MGNKVMPFVGSRWLVLSLIREESTLELWWVRNLSPFLIGYLWVRYWRMGNMVTMPFVGSR